MHHKNPISRVVQTLIDHNPSAVSLAECQSRISTSEKSRAKMYFYLNPSLSVSCVYSSSVIIPEYLRIAYSRIKLSSHRLRIETGRWTRPITPEADRICPCREGVQSEEHVLLNCPLTAGLRDNTAALNVDPHVSELLTLSSYDAHEVCKLCFETLEYFSTQ